MAQQQQHPIFDEIEGGNLEVQWRVRADAAVLDERQDVFRRTPLIYAIFMRKPAIALWLIEHRGQHDLDSTDRFGWRALHWACARGPLSVVEALVVAGANPAALEQEGWTPLMWAAENKHANIVTFLLQQPAVKATIDAVSTSNYTALSRASYNGHLSIVQLLLNAGADPTIPAGQHSPLNRAITQRHHDVAALLRTAIAEPQRPRSLLKARALLDAALAVPNARNDSADGGEPQALQRQQQQEALAVTPAYLEGRVAAGRELPAVVVVVDDDSNEEEEELVACVKYALGLEGGGGVHEEGQGPPPQGMVHDVFIELCELLVPTWDRANV